MLLLSLKQYPDLCHLKPVSIYSGIGNDLPPLADYIQSKSAMDFRLVNRKFRLKNIERSPISTLKLASKPGAPESLQNLVEFATNPGANATALSSTVSGMDDKSRQTRDKKVTSQAVANRGDYNHVEVVLPESFGFPEQVPSLFAELFRICELPTANDAATSDF